MACSTVRTSSIPSNPILVASQSWASQRSARGLPLPSLSITGPQIASAYGDHTRLVAADLYGCGQPCQGARSVELWQACAYREPQRHYDDNHEASADGNETFQESPVA